MIYVATSKDNKDALMHYGVKGMRWGKSKWGGRDGYDDQQNSGYLMGRHISQNYYKTHNKPKNVFQLLRDVKNVSGKINKEADKHYTHRKSKYGGKDGQDNSGLMYRKVAHDYYKTHKKPKNIFQVYKDAINMSGKAMEQEAKHYTKRKTTNGNRNLSSGFKGKTGRELKNGHSSTNARRGGWSKEYLQTLHYNKKRNKYYN